MQNWIASSTSSSTVWHLCLENFVVMEMRKQSSWSKTQPQLYYWRTASGQEVDIVLEDSTGQPVGIEVKAGATMQREDLRGLQILADAARKHWVRGVVHYAGTEIRLSCGER
ncbi:MAG: DUF4143 domain-containing protein [Candidatus Sulfotelmatobacter sp.]